ncbi:MAG: WD40 repeat domain-containing protein [Pseudomonadales bacterium]|nr:WD40 repeat domain-containing protein [Pseudomonadales bacterium]
MSSESNEPTWIVTPTTGLQINSVAMSDDGKHILTGTSAEYDTSDEFAVYYYTTDGTSPTNVWSDPLGDNVQQGVFWVAVSGDGQYGAAGGEYGSGRGFLRTYQLSVGVSSRQEFDYSSRINEVESSNDGSALIAVESANLQFLTRASDQYEQTTVNISGSYLRSCTITPDGRYLAVAGEIYQDEMNFAETRNHKEETESSTGILYLYENNNGTLNYLGHYEADNGILRITLTRDGQYFAASTKGGEILLFANPINKQDKLFPLWIYKNEDYTLGLSYALAICHNSAGDLYVASGGNYEGSGSGQADTTAYGYAYVVKNTVNTENQNIPERQWIYKLTYCPNPGMNMDENATYLTATDGQPIFSNAEVSDVPSETPGNFYLFNAQQGSLIWQYTTQLMNWPMVINPSGTTALGGSDDGSLYYWTPLQK